MMQDKLKAKLLAAVANGSALSEAALANIVSTNHAQEGIHQLCRSVRLTADIQHIKENPKKYLELAAKISMTPYFTLRRHLLDKLCIRLKLRTVDDLTPSYVSKLTAAALLDAKFTLLGVAEIQDWLIENGTTLKHQAPRVDHETDVRRAISLLDAFGFDITNARKQLSDIRPALSD